MFFSILLETSILQISLLQSLFESPLYLTLCGVLVILAQYLWGAYWVWTLNNKPI